MNFLFLFSILKMLADPGENMRFQPAMFNSFVSTQFILKNFTKTGYSKCKSVLYYDCVKELFLD